MADELVMKESCGSRRPIGVFTGLIEAGISFHLYATFTPNELGATTIPELYAGCEVNVKDLKLMGTTLRAFAVGQGAIKRIFAIVRGDDGLLFVNFVKKANVCNLKCSSMLTDEVNNPAADEFADFLQGKTTELAWNSIRKQLLAQLPCPEQKCAAKKPAKVCREVQRGAAAAAAAAVGSSPAKRKPVKELTAAQKLAKFDANMKFRARSFPGRQNEQRLQQKRDVLVAAVSAEKMRRFCGDDEAEEAEKAEEAGDVQEEAVQVRVVMM